MSDDLVRVVRCKDCCNSFRLTDQDGNKLILCTKIGSRDMKENDFCSYGKECNY